jgi:signal transduction histidine kinase
MGTARLMGTRSSEIYGLRKCGEEFPADAAISKLEVNGRSLLIVSMRDISEQKRMEDEERLLAAAGRMLVSVGLQYEHLLTDICASLVGSIAEWCALDMYQTATGQRLKWAHADPAKTALCEALEQYPLARLPSAAIRAAEVTYRPELIEEPSAEFLASIAHDPEHLRLLRTLETRSMIMVRLVARGHTVGVLAVGSSVASRRYTKHHVRLLGQVGSLVALALDNARLHEGLQRSLRARDELLGIVAHDLRSPLNAIVLQVRALELTREPGDARAHDGIQRIRRAATEMNRLIQDLLEVTRLEAGQKLSIVPGAVEAQSVVAEAVERQRASVSRSSCTFQVSAATESVHAWADRARILQVLNNLLTNAVKFSRGQIEVGAAPYAAEILFWVRDNGLGIPAKDIPVLFDRFWQAARIDRQGAGLGLSIVKGIVESHGGRVWVRSEMGIGTTFYFTLPTAPPAVQSDPAIEALPGGGVTRGYRDNVLTLDSNIAASDR